MRAAVVTLGCLHHTGNLQRAIDKVHRALRTGGFALIMVYNAFSYRRWVTATDATWRTLKRDYLGGADEAAASEADRGAYDRSSSGAATPSTVFTSSHRLRRMCAAFRDVTIRKENAEREGPFRHFDRLTLLPVVGPTIGFDLCHTRKVISTAAR